MLHTLAIVTSTLLAAGPGAPSGTGVMLAPKVGFYKTTTSLSGAFYGALEVGYALPVMNRQLAVVLEGSWQRPGLAGTLSSSQLGYGGVTPDAGFKLAEQQVSFLLSGVYRARIPAVSGLTAYGGLGPGLYLHTATVDAFGNRYVEYEPSIGFQLLAGGEYAAGPGSAFLELHYHFTQIDLATTGAVNAGGFLAAGAGYRFAF